MKQAAPPAQGRRARLRAKLAVVRGSRHKKHARTFITYFRDAAQNEQAEPAFAAVAALPDWVLADEADRDMIAKVAALLYHREAVDAEIDGARLAALSQSVGEDMFDALCDCQPPAAKAESRQLPRPDGLAAIGHGLMMAGLPQPLSHRFPGARGASDIAELCNLATEIVARHGHRS